MTQPAPAPRFSRTKPEVVSAPHEPGSDLETVLSDWNISRKTGENHDDI
jgi:alpha-methylacyl-CoA racemase